MFREVLRALRDEGSENATYDAWADSLEAAMKLRADGWARHTSLATSSDGMCEPSFLALPSML